MTYVPADNRYENLPYRRCGKSGLLLPAVSLGFWHNFGSNMPFGTQREIVHTAFDNGITHFDLANNYGPEGGEAERNFGRILREDLHAYRDEMIISTKAGHGMWAGPYGNWGSRKHMIASLDQSLKRMGLDYVDIYYHHRPDPETPLEETMTALDHIVRSGKALYVGISNYRPKDAQVAISMLRELGTPCLIHQPNYSMLDRWIEDGLTDVLRENGVGCICFSPLQSGLLTGKYLHGIPADSRAAREPESVGKSWIREDQQRKIEKLQEVAEARGQKLSQLAISWVLRDPVVTSALIGASRPEQVLENIEATKHTDFTQEELDRIEAILAGN